MNASLNEVRPDGVSAWWVIIVYNLVAILNMM